MRKELDEKLCAKYPKIFANRFEDMNVTAMCWGFECGDGWYNIIDQLCGNIQNHIDWSIKSNEWDLKYAAIEAAVIAGDDSLLKEEFSGYTPAHIEQRKAEILSGKIHEVRPIVHQVVAEQVKEKFGTLRFYYQGGDDYIRGLLSMAESMSGVTCEDCGKPGTRGGGGWIRTACVEHGGSKVEFGVEEEQNDF